MGSPQATTPPTANLGTPPAPNAPPQTTVSPNAPAAGGGSPNGRLPYQPQPMLAAVLLVAALAVIFGTGAWFIYNKSWTPPGFTGGGAAAAAGILVVLALVLRYPTLIMDDTIEAGGEPSTMRIMSLAIVLTFCLIMLRTGWNSGTLPSLENQGNWVWLVTAALGGKALQKFAEVQDKGKNGG